MERSGPWQFTAPSSQGSSSSAPPGNIGCGRYLPPAGPCPPRNSQFLPQDGICLSRGHFQGKARRQNFWAGMAMGVGRGGERHSDLDEFNGPSKPPLPPEWEAGTSSCPSIRDCTRSTQPSCFTERTTEALERRSPWPESHWISITEVGPGLLNQKAGNASPRAPVDLGTQKGSKSLSQEFACELEPP